MANAQGHRHIARRLAVQALYQWEITGGALADAAALESRFLTDASPKTYDVDYFRKLIREIPVNSDYLDELIKDYLDRPIDKVDVVERAVLRLAVWEMTREPEVPDAVAINEAVELAKLFGSDHSYRFVNGVLDKFKTSQAAIDDSGAIGAPVPGGGEFALINTYFKRTGPQPPAVVVGIGDDAAVIAPPPDQQLVVTVDTMVSGVHFSADADPHSLGHKLMAVNLSDLAAMGATPAWATLALTMPEVDAAWLSAFAGGLFAMADQYGVALAGGDTTQGPLTLTLQLGGSIPRRGALLRSGAQSGDGIYVTGTLGDAGLGLRILREECDAGEHNDFLVTRLQRPQPRVQAGLALRGTAHSAIDISDGLCQDLGHVLTASGVGATIDVDALPLSSAYRALLDEVGHLPALTSGDDYELLFTLKDSRSEVLANLGIVATRIGDIEAQPGLRFRGQSASDLAAAIQDAGYQHFLTPGTVGGAA